jgi:hypothetical protein
VPPLNSPVVTPTMRFHPTNLLNVKAKGMAITAVINIILAIVPIPKSKRYAMAHQES